MDDFVETLDLSDLLLTYKGGGASAYHPKAMLKLLLYGYLNRSYSSLGQTQDGEGICLLLAGLLLLKKMDNLAFFHHKVDILFSLLHFGAFALFLDSLFFYLKIID